MRFRPNITAVLLAGVFAGVTLAAGPSGPWRWEHPDPENQQLVKDVLTIEVDDGEVSGTYQMIGGGAAGTYKVNNGKLAGDTFTWNFDLPVGGGQTLNISFTGSVSGDEIAGTVKLGDLGESPWAATRNAVAVDPSGTWRWEHQDAASQQTVKDILILKVDGGKVSGTYEQVGGGTVGTYKVNYAKVFGSTVSWGFDLPIGGQTLSVAFTGKVSGDDVTGSVRLGELGEFPWTAKRDAAGTLSTWNLTLEMPDGQVQHPVMTVSEAGGKLSATYHVNEQQFKVEDLEVSEDGQVTFTLYIKEIGLTSKFSGKVDGDNAKGVVKYAVGGQSGELVWTAHKSAD